MGYLWSSNYKSGGVSPPAPATAGDKHRYNTKSKETIVKTLAIIVVAAFAALAVGGICYDMGKEAGREAGYFEGRVSLEGYITESEDYIGVLQDTVLDWAKGEDMKRKTWQAMRVRLDARHELLMDEHVWWEPETVPTEDEAIGLLEADIFEF